MGFIKKNGRKKEETDSIEKNEYQISEDEELKACRYCRVMIPKTAKVCPNCRKRLKKNWLGIFLLLCLLAACTVGACYYITVYSVSKSVIGNVEVVQSEEAVQDIEDSQPMEEEPMTGNEPADGNELLAEEELTETADAETDATVQLENLPEILTVLEGPADAESEKSDGLIAGVEIEEEAEENSVTEKEDEPANDSEAEKEEELEEESELVKNDDEDAEEENDHAGMMADAGMDTASESGSDSEDGTVEVTDISIYTEEEFRDMCSRIDYKKLLRSQELYLNAAVTETLTVIEQVDGGLFDENIYYLCRREDEQGIVRYYVIRDDREDDAVPILEGDALRVYGQLFGSCKLPGYLVKSQPVVPALTMVYYDLLEE
ncbi:MAG: hypothetical protein HDR27_08315 [Lachnospiraceae bacterium]|nr:hypothetical protein [Lachnospiraceae bacterium]